MGCEAEGRKRVVSVAEVVILGELSVDSRARIGREELLQSDDVRKSGEQGGGELVQSGGE